MEAGDKVSTGVLFICPGVRWCDKKCRDMRWSILNHSEPHTHNPNCDGEIMCPGKCIPFAGARSIYEFDIIGVLQESGLDPSHIKITRATLHLECGSGVESEGKNKK